MNDITIRNLDHASVQRLRQLAWQDGRPLEELVRDLLLAAPELQPVASRLDRWRKTCYHSDSMEMLPPPRAGESLPPTCSGVPGGRRGTWVSLSFASWTTRLSSA